MKRTFTLLLLAGISVSCFAQKTLLRLNLSKDSTYYLNHNASMTIEENIQGQKQVISTLIKGKLSHKVVSIKDTVYELDVRYENLAMTVAMGDRTMMDVNTEDKDKQDIFSKLMSGILNKSITVFISNSGKVLEIKNSENLYKGIFDNFPQVSEEQKGKFLKQMEDSFGDKALKSNFQEAFAMYPANKIGVNDKWVATSTLNSIIVAVITTNYIMKEPTDKDFVIHGDATIQKTGQEADYKEINGLPIKVENIAGVSSADYKIDKKTGWISYARVSKDVKAEMDVKDNPKLPGGAIIPMSINVAFTMSNK
jgi:hypothetical protein